MSKLKKNRQQVRTVAEGERKDSSDHLMAVAAAFDKAGRPVPSHVLRRLWGLRSEWKNRKDIPEVVRAACEMLDRQPRGEA
jgi:hypothetical protein